MKDGIYYVNPTLIADAVARAYGRILPTYYIMAQRGRVVKSGRLPFRLPVAPAVLDEVFS